MVTTGCPVLAGSKLTSTSASSSPTNTSVPNPSPHDASTPSEPPSLIQVTADVRRSGDVGLAHVWAVISPLFLLPLGLTLGLLLPPPLTLTLTLLLGALPAGLLLLRHLHLLPPTPYASRTSYARTTARISGDFVVFLIGSRLNRPLPDLHCLRLSREFDAMMDHLRASDPGVTGFLGDDPYVGAHNGRSSTLSVQYWRSYEHLRAFAQSPHATHLRVWREYNARGGVEASPYGIWHETYLVRDGEYEAIYGAMPPMGLALASGNIQLADGRMRTSAGRIKGKQHLDSHPVEVDDVLNKAVKQY